MELKKIVVIGGGVLGSQIAFQASYCGYDVSIWLRSPESVSRCQKKIDAIYQRYQSDLQVMATPEGKTPANWAMGLADPDKFDLDVCLLKAAAAYQNLKLVTDLKEAVRNADVVIESMAENKADKKAFYQMLAPLLPVKTFVLTNSSTLLPSQFAKDTGRPDKFCSFHFANTIHKKNTVEVMRQKFTSEETFSAACQLGEGMRMIVFKVNKEKSGYLLNSMLVPFLFAAFDLTATGVGSVEDVNKCWKLATGAPLGPFEIADNVGLKTCYDIVSMYLKVPSFLAPYHFKDIARWMKKEYMDKGRMGRACGHGFFDYQ